MPQMQETSTNLYLWALKTFQDLFQIYYSDASDGV